MYNQYNNDFDFVSANDCMIHTKYLHHQDIYLHRPSAMYPEYLLDYTKLQVVPAVVAQKVEETETQEEDKTIQD